jgi:hypothetical protein
MLSPGTVGVRTLDSPGTVGEAILLASITGYPEGSISQMVENAARAADSIEYCFQSRFTLESAAVGCPPAPLVQVMNHQSDSRSELPSQEGTMTSVLKYQPLNRWVPDTKRNSIELQGCTGRRRPFEGQSTGAITHAAVESAMSPPANTTADNQLFWYFT